MLAPPLKCPSQGVEGDGTCEELIRKEAGRPGHKTVSSSTSFDAFLFKRERESGVFGVNTDHLNVLTDQ